MKRVTLTITIQAEVSDTAREASLKQAWHTVDFNHPHLQGVFEDMLYAAAILPPSGDIDEDFGTDSVESVVLGTVKELDECEPTT